MAFTGWMPVTVGEDTAVLDVQTMASLDSDAYKAYIRGHLMRVDHHEILKSSLFGYPYATSPKQVDALILVLEEFRARMAR
jgi:hypothetical protein